MIRMREIINTYKFSVGKPEGKELIWNRTESIYRFWAQ